MSCYRNAQRVALAMRASGISKSAGMSVYYNAVNVHSGKAKRAFDHLMVASDVETLVELIELIFFNKPPRPKKRTVGKYVAAASAASIAFGLSLFTELNKAAIEAVLKEYRFWMQWRKQRQRALNTLS